MALPGLALLDDLPDNLKPPDGLSLKPSSIAIDEIGVWCCQPIEVGRRFGPFMGERIKSYPHGQAVENYAWEVLDLDTHEFLHYIDSSDLSKSNWMRFVRCANYFEEQNIVSEQDGTDIYYKVIKEISPNEELLTWYDVTQFKKSVKARSRMRKPGRKPLKKLKITPQTISAENGNTNSESGYTKTTDESNEAEKSSDIEKSRCRAESDSDRSPRCRRKPSILDSYVCGAESLPEMDGRRNRLSSSKSTSPKIMNESTSPMALKSDEPKVLGNQDEMDEKHFYFVMTSEHLVQEGRHFLFKCDVCSATYKHAFSLKRHFLRRHVNYTYITEHDRVNCGLNGKRYLELQSIVNNDPNLLKTDTEKDTESSMDKDDKNTTVAEELKNPPPPDQSELPGAVVKEDNNVDDVKDKPSDDGPKNPDFGSDAEPYMPVVSPVSVPDSTAESETNQNQLNASTNSSDSVSGLKVTTNGEEKISTEEPSNKETDQDALLDAFFESQLAALNKKLAVLDGKAEPSPEKNKFTNCQQPILNKSDKVFWCEHCNKLFPSLKELKLHYSQNHPLSSTVREKTDLQCSLCQLKFPGRKELDKHQKVHHAEGSGLTCPKCLKVFKTLGRFRKHEQNVQCVGRVTCQICSADFANRRNFMEHYRRFHSEKSTDSKPVIIPENDGAVDDETGKINSTYIEEDTDSNDKSDGSREDRDQSLKLANQTHGFRFACTVCKKRFREYHFMCRHRRLAHQKPRRLSQKRVPKEEAKLPTNSEEDPSAFYANVARNIAENLTFFIDGTKEIIDKFQNGNTEELSNDQCVDQSLKLEWSEMNFAQSFDPNTINTCVTQNAIDLTAKVVTESNSNVSSTGRPILDIIQTRIQPWSQTPYVHRNKEQRAEALNFYNGNPRLRYVCLVCAKRFDAMDKLNEHSAVAHPRIVSDHIELDEDCSIPVLHFPSNQGILGKTGDSDEVYSPQITCTKCSEKFLSIDALHSHIVDCGNLQSEEKSTRANSIFKLYCKPRKPWGPHRLFRPPYKVRKLQEQKQNCRLMNPVYYVNDDEDFVEENCEGKEDMYAAKQHLSEELPRRSTRSRFLNSYDPGRHVRRRDTRPILDTEQCRACLRRFKNLLELERHARVCTEKQLLRTTQNAPDAGMRCVYCKKHFTYRLSLKKHLIEICKVKKELLESDNLTMDKIEQEGIMLQNIEETLPLAPLKMKSGEFVRKKKRKCVKLGIKPLKRTVDYRLKKKRAAVRAAVNEAHGAVVEQPETSTEPEQLNSSPEAAFDVGKRSRKMTVKALESASLQMTLDSLSCSEKRLGLFRKRKKRMPITLEGKKRRLKFARVATSSSRVFEENPNKCEEEAISSGQQNTKEGIADIGECSDEIVEAAVAHKKPTKLSRKKKLDVKLNSSSLEHDETPVHGSEKMSVCLNSKTCSGSADMAATASDKTSEKSETDPYEFEADSECKAPESKIVFNKDGKVRKKPGRKPKLKLSVKPMTNSANAGDGTVSSKEVNKENGVKADVGKKLTRKRSSELLPKIRRTASRLSAAVPLVFSKRVANLQKKLRKSS